MGHNDFRGRWRNDEGNGYDHERAAYGVGQNARGMMVDQGLRSMYPLPLPPAPSMPPALPGLDWNNMQAFLNTAVQLQAPSVAVPLPFQNVGDLERQMTHPAGLLPSFGNNQQNLNHVERGRDGFRNQSLPQDNQSTPLEGIASHLPLRIEESRIPSQQPIFFNDRRPPVAENLDRVHLGIQGHFSRDESVYNVVDGQDLGRDSRGMEIEEYEPQPFQVNQNQFPEVGDGWTQQHALSHSSERIPASMGPPDRRASSESMREARRKPRNRKRNRRKRANVTPEHQPHCRKENPPVIAESDSSPSTPSSGRMGVSVPTPTEDGLPQDPSGSCSDGEVVETRNLGNVNDHRATACSQGSQVPEKGIQATAEGEGDASPSVDVEADASEPAKNDLAKPPIADADFSTEGHDITSSSQVLVKFIDGSTGAAGKAGYEEEEGSTKPRETEKGGKKGIGKHGESEGGNDTKFVSVREITARNEAAVELGHPSSAAATRSENLLMSLREKALKSVTKPKTFDPVTEVHNGTFTSLVAVDSRPSGTTVGVTPQVKNSQNASKIESANDGKNPISRSPISEPAVYTATNGAREQPKALMISSDIVSLATETEQKRQLAAPDESAQKSPQNLVLKVHSATENDLRNVSNREASTDAVTIAKDDVVNIVSSPSASEHEDFGHGKALRSGEEVLAQTSAQRDSSFVSTSASFRGTSNRGGHGSMYDSETVVVLEDDGEATAGENEVVELDASDEEIRLAKRKRFTTLEQALPDRSSHREVSQRGSGSIGSSIERIFDGSWETDRPAETSQSVGEKEQRMMESEPVSVCETETQTVPKVADVAVHASPDCTEKGTDAKPLDEGWILESAQEVLEALQASIGLWRARVEQSRQRVNQLKIFLETAEGDAAKTEAEADQECYRMMKLTESIESALTLRGYRTKADASSGNLLPSTTEENPITEVTNQAADPTTKGSAKTATNADDDNGLFDRACLSTTQDLDHKRGELDESTQTQSGPSREESERLVETDLEAQNRLTDIPDRSMVEAELEPEPDPTSSGKPSPLNLFRAYRLKDLAKNGCDLDRYRYELLDPMKEMCPFELHGICKDKNCTYQHLRDLTITPEIILQEILCYADNDVYVANMSVLQKRLVENEDPKSVIRDALELSGFNGEHLPVRKRKRLSRQRRLIGKST